MKKSKALIIQVLKEFEQQDYKRGGVSIAPEMYTAIADELCDRLLDENKKESTPKEVVIKTKWDLRKNFEQLRFDKNCHLGMGDIRLTIGMQEEICQLVERFYEHR